ncbi:hypothetical protein F4809DRAFT_228003 [Biscogniauxia mediterranea]|nr:hypothetical protein F4809DRAFT_228003 [Biscogniauxia mediterranea]
MDIDTDLPYIKALPYELWLQIFLQVPDQRSADALSHTCKALSVVERENRDRIKLNARLNELVALAGVTTKFASISIVKYATMTVLASSVTGPEGFDDLLARFSIESKWGQSLDDFLPDDDQLKPLLSYARELVDSMYGADVHEPTFEFYVQAVLAVEAWCRLPPIRVPIATLKRRYLDTFPTRVKKLLEYLINILLAGDPRIPAAPWSEQLTMLTDKYRNVDYRILVEEPPF